MTPADDVIARAARAVRPALIARAAEAGGTGTPPGEAEIALAIRSMVGRVRPGTVIEEDGLVVDWQSDGRIRILLPVAVLKREELPA